MPDAEQQRAFALEVAQKLRAGGFESLWAGGCVRDQLLGITPKDYDVATNATPDQIRDLFGHRRTLPIGAAFGVITVLGPRAAGQIEVATFRTDAEYSDGRHPDSVEFTTAEHDAERRDFTINGLFFDPLSEKVVDYVNGQQDLEHGIIRAIGDPLKRLHEDRLRMLRAVRFAATFRFEIESATLAAIREMAATINTVSAERIGMEICRMLVNDNRAIALSLLRDTGLLTHVLPEIAELTSSEFESTRDVLSKFKHPSFPLALAALLSSGHYNQAFPDPSRYSYPSLAPRSPLWAQQVGRRLRYSNKDIERAAWILGELRDIHKAPDVPWPRVQRMLASEGATELVALREAIAGVDDQAATFCRERLAWPRERLDPPPLLNGGDLIRHGLAPGPHFASLLEQVRDAQLVGEIGSREEALALVDRLRA